MAFQKPYGMHDILPEDQPYWDHLRGTFRTVYRQYGFQRMDTPVLENTAVFLKGVGEGTDIVDKEMYSFIDKGDNPLTLRPEFTAGIIRAYIENGLKTRPQPVKLASLGPLFRRDRPGAGRFRQFYQVNAEIIGSDDPAADAELLALAAHYGRAIGIAGMTLLINSTGCPACKPGYLEALQAHLRTIKDKLNRLDVDRIERNPLRVLDSKEPETQAVMETVPLIRDFLCDTCRDHFAEVMTLIGHLKIPCKQSPRLVRGLDYYTKTVFEFVSDRVPETGTVLGGGRYDGLAEILDGPPTPAVGFAGGMERLILALKAEEGEAPAPAKMDVYVAYIGEGTKTVAMGLADELRRQGIAAVMTFGRKGVKAQLKGANRSGARFCVIVGESELAQGNMQVRDMQASTQDLVPVETIVPHLSDALDGDA